MKDKNLELLLREDAVQQVDTLETMYGVEFMLCTYLHRSRICEVIVFYGNGFSTKFQTSVDDISDSVAKVADEIGRSWFGESRSSLRMKMQLRGLS